MENIKPLIRLTKSLIKILESMLNIVDRIRYLDSQGTEAPYQSLQQRIELQLYQLRTELKVLESTNKYGEKIGRLSPKIQPFKLLPDVRDFRIELQGEDPLFKKYGLNKKIKPKLTFTRYTNRKINRYIL